MLYINDQKMPNPKKYDVQMSDLDSSESTRNELGELLRNRIRQGVTKISLAWDVRGSSLASILSAIEPAELTVQYYDPRTNAYDEKTMYASDRSCTMKLYTDDMDIADILWEVSFNLIEF